MQAVAVALGDLNDPGAVDRVLRWAADHFKALEADAPAPPAALGEQVPPLQLVSREATADKQDPENLDSLFETDAAPMGVGKLRTARPQPVPSMISSFVADFQKLANDWQRG